jgi:polyhydroxybutyrate depolymerase
MPVVFGLHGFASKASGLERVSGWSRIADAENLLVVYLEGTSFPQRWNAADPFLAQDVDDVQFFRDAVADVAQIAKTDPARIYVTGVSNGGGMTHRIACEAADLVAAVGTVAALPFEVPGGCSPARPVALIAFHGTADPLVQYRGGAFHNSRLTSWLDVSRGSLVYPAVEGWIAGWAVRNGCRRAPDVIPGSGKVSSIHYAGCREGADVILYTIHEGGHTWPGSKPIPFLGKTSQDIDASVAMWEFFQAHPLQD